MSAPESVYSKNNVRYMVGGTLEKGIITSLALALSEYGTKENIKSLFFLDDVRMMKDLSDKDVFFGALKPGSANYKMHATKRIGKGRGVEDENNYVWLNDAGLNTLPTLTGRIDLYYENYMTFSLNIKSSYYASTTQYGMLMENLSQTSVQPFYLFMQDKTVNPKESYTRYFLQDTKIYQFNAGDNIKFTPFAKNEEGTFFGDSVAVILKPAVRIVPLKKYFNFSDIQFMPTDTNSEDYIGILTEDDYTKQFGINQMLEMDTTGLPKPYPYQSTVFVEGGKGKNFNEGMLNLLLPFGYYYGFTDQKETKKYVFQIDATAQDKLGQIRGWLEPRERTGKIVVTSVSSMLGTGKVRITVNLTGDEVTYPTSVKGALQTPLKLNGQPTGTWLAIATHTLTVSSNGISSIEVDKSTLAVGDKMRFLVTEVAGVAFPASDLDKLTMNESTYTG